MNVKICNVTLIFAPVYKFYCTASLKKQTINIRNGQDIKYRHNPQTTHEQVVNHHSHPIGYHLFAPRQITLSHQNTSLITLSKV